jgi:signal peptidase
VVRVDPRSSSYEGVGECFEVELMKHLSTVVLGVALAVFAAAAIGRFVYGYGLAVVTSGSMRPTIQPGDAVVTMPVPVAALRTGDVIALVPPSGGEPVLHRIRTIDADGTVLTRGDANSVDDPWRAQLRGATAYRLVAIVPLIGWLASVRGPLLISVALLIGGLLVVDWRDQRVALARP